MTKSFFIAAALTLAASAVALPAFAQEGNGAPFANRTPGVTTATTRLAPDVGSASFPDVYGRPGSGLAAPEDEVTGLSNESPVQTANSEPRGFTVGTMGYASLPERSFFVGMTQ